jgi:hypothetical protein
MSSTRKTSGHPGPTYSLSDIAVVVAATTSAAATEAAEAAEAAEAVIEAAAAAVVEAVEAVEAAGGGGSPLADGATEAADSSLSSVFATLPSNQLGNAAMRLASSSFAIDEQKLGRFRRRKAHERCQSVLARKSMRPSGGLVSFFLFD